MNNLTVKFIEDDGRKWYRINGHCTDTEVDFDNESFAVTADGTILDADGCPLIPGDSQTIAIENAVERFNREQEKESEIDWDDFKDYFDDMAAGSGGEDKLYFQKLAADCNRGEMTKELSIWHDKGDYRK